MKKYTILIFLVCTYTLVSASSVCAITLKERMIVGSVSTVIQQESRQIFWSEKLRSVARYFRYHIFSQLPLNVQAKLQEEGTHFEIEFKNLEGGRAHFYGSSTELRVEIPFSYLNSAIESYEELLTHEIFHMIHYLYRPLDPSWATEGLAQLFQYQITQKHTGQNIIAAFRDISTPLIHHIHADQMSSAHYGHNALYFFYLQQQCLDRNFIWHYLESSLPNPGDSIDHILIRLNSSKSQCQSLLNSIINFEIARVYNRPNYNNIDNVEQFFIMSSMPSPTEVLISNRAELRALIRHLTPLTPHLIKLTSSRLVLPERSDLAVFYIEESFPYRIFTENHADLNVKILLLKMPTAD